MGTYCYMHHTPHIFCYRSKKKHMVNIFLLFIESTFSITSPPYFKHITFWCYSTVNCYLNPFTGLACLLFNFRIKWLWCKLFLRILCTIAKWNSFPHDRDTRILYNFSSMGFFWLLDQGNRPPHYNLPWLI
jgi:hypothetical protein